MDTLTSISVMVLSGTGDPACFFVDDAFLFAFAMMNRMPWKERKGRKYLTSKILKSKWIRNSPNLCGGSEVEDGISRSIISEFSACLSIQVFLLLLCPTCNFFVSCRMPLSFVENVQHSTQRDPDWACLCL